MSIDNQMKKSSLRDLVLLMDKPSLQKIIYLICLQIWLESWSKGVWFK